MSITISLPDEVAGMISSDPTVVEREVLEAVLLEGYRSGKVSASQIGRALHLSRLEVDGFLKRHNVPLDYTKDDLESDRRTLDKLALK